MTPTNARQVQRTRRRANGIEGNRQQHLRRHRNWQIVVECHDLFDFHSMGLVASSCSYLETDGYNATSPERIAVDFFVHQPSIGSVGGIQCHRRVVTPALNAEARVEVAGQERGTGETSRPGRDLRIRAQLAR
jgi:hypothetical protein